MGAADGRQLNVAVLTIWDRLLIYLLLALSVGSIVGLEALPSQASPRSTAVISVAGKTVVSWKLDGRRRHTFRMAGGGQCLVETRPGAIRVAESNCPKQICVAMGWLADSSRTIVCAPHRLVIKIEGGPVGLASRVDAVNR